MFDPRKLPGGDAPIASSADPEMDVAEAVRRRAGLLAEARREVDELVRLLGAVYPYVGFPYDPNKARALWDDFIRLMVEVEATLERHPGAKVVRLDPGNVRELPPGRRPRRRW